MSRRAGLTCIEAIVALFLLGGFWLLLTPALRYKERGSSRTKCSSALRQLGLAAVQYSDDKRFFPHAGGKGLMSGPDGNGPTKVVRALQWFGYHDNPEGWICPQSTDRFLPITDPETRGSPRRWFWAGTSIGEEKVSPFKDGLPDPALVATDELSYGWSRRFMTANARSTAMVGADRAQRGTPGGELAGLPPGVVGNHVDGMNVLLADATVTWVTSEDERAPLLTSTEGPGGCLAVQPLAPPDREAAAAAARDRLLADLGREAVRYVPVALLALLLLVWWWLTRPRPDGATAAAPAAPGPAAGPGGAVAPVRPSRVEACRPRRARS